MDANTMARYWPINPPGPSGVQRNEMRLCAGPRRVFICFDDGMLKSMSMPWNYARWNSGRVAEGRAVYIVYLVMLFGILSSGEGELSSSVFFITTPHTMYFEGLG